MALIYGDDIRQIINQLKDLVDDQDLIKNLEDLLEYEERAESIRVRYSGIADDDIRSFFEREKLSEKRRDDAAGTATE